MRNIRHSKTIKATQKATRKAKQERSRSDTINKNDKNVKNDNIIAGTPAENENHQNIIKIFDIFRTINPTINYGHKTNRQAVTELVKLFGIDKTIKYAKYAVSIQGRDFAPTITNPYHLKTKFAELQIFYKKSQNNGNVVFIS